MTKGGEKGYGFQDNVKSYFVLLMDLERTIRSVNSEIDTEKLHSMDDIEIICDDGQHYFLQCKDYSELDRSEIIVENNMIKVRGAKHCLSHSGKNVLVVHNLNMSPTTKFMGLDAIVVGDLIIARCTISDRDILSNRYQSHLRVNKIINLVDRHTENGVGLVSKSDLPLLCTYSTELADKTVNIDREIAITPEINCVVGKPGSGKSHFCNTLMNKLDSNNSLFYRFWISNDDSNYEKRLSFEEFKNDISTKLFNTPDKKTIEDVINCIKNKKCTVVLDGLDHVYNYRPTDYNRYELFIDALSNNTVIIFCRPFDRLKWKKIELDDWKKDQSDHFIKKAFNIDNKSIQDEIFDSVKGYPLLTYYVASNYCLTGKVQNCDNIHEISDYYAKLTESVKNKTLLSVISISPRYLTREDIDCLMERPLSKIVKEFMNLYPFIFSSKLNRFSPLHDSFCNYLKSVPECNDEDFHDLMTKNAFESLLRGETRFMSRIKSFDLNQEQKQQLLQKYCSFDCLITVLDNTYDWESIVDFYDTLKIFLDDCPNFFLLTEYYEFILISLVLERRLALEDEKLMYYFAKQLLMQEKNESEIFSTGLLWAMIVKIKAASGNLLLQWAIDNNQNTERYLECFNEDIENYVLRINLSNDPTYRNRLNYELISDQWARCGYLSFVYDDDSNEFHKLVVGLTENPKEYGNKLLGYLSSIGVKKSEPGFNSIPCKIVDYLYYSGKLRERNPYLKTIDEIIASSYKRGAYDVGESIMKCFALADVENRVVNLDGLWKYYFMYWERKDSSVLSLPLLLIKFELKGLISLADSIGLIINLQNMSEKGIRHLLSEYVNNRGKESIEYCVEYDLIDYLRFDFLDSIIIDMLPEDEITNEFYKLIKYVNDINYSNIANIVGSRYFSLLREMIITNHTSVHEVPPELFEIFSNCLCDYRKNEESEKHDMMRDNCVMINDEDVIIAQKIDMLNLAEYHDGWHNVLPFPEFYANYDSVELNENYDMILHKSLFTKYYQTWYGSWYYCPYTVLRLAEIANVHIDWIYCFNMFQRFMTISQIWNLSPGDK